MTAAAVDAGARLRRELAVTRHFVDKAAPVVGSTTALPAEPYFRGGFGLTLWPFIRQAATARSRALSHLHHLRRRFG